MDDEQIDTTTAHKAIGIETTLCANGAINVRSDRGSGRVHTVFVDPTGDVDRCTCPGFTHHGHCYHSDAIASNGRLRAAARACADRQTIATDGGHDDERYSVGYSITIDGTPFAGSLIVENTGMSDSAARQYAANHLLDTSDVKPGSFDVNAIDVEYRKVSR